MHYTLYYKKWKLTLDYTQQQALFRIIATQIPRDYLLDVFEAFIFVL